MQSSTIFWSLFSFYWVSFVWDIYLAYRQYRVHLINEKRPQNVSEIISEEDYNKARLYKLDRHRFGFVEAIFGKLQMTVVLLCNILPLIWNWTGRWSFLLFGEGEIYHSIMFISFCSLVETFISLPFSFYDIFVIEQKHGFNKQTVSFFFVDSLKKLVVSQLITVPIVAGVIWIVNASGKYFFVYVWLFLCVVVFVMMTIYPEFIAPLFDKYTPLPQSDLKTKIEALALGVDYPLKKLYVVQGSKRSTHSNAYMYGFWKNKRIVLYDTLLSEELNKQLKEIIDAENSTSKDQGDEQISKQSTNDGSQPSDDEVKDAKTILVGEKEHRTLGMTDDEVVAVLGHELGHWKLWHNVHNLVITEINTLFLLAVFAYFYRQESLYMAFGFNDQPVIIGILLVMQFVTAPYNELISIGMSFMSRYNEFAADRFSAELGYASLLCSSLIKLGKDNLSLPIDDWLYSAVNHSHPPTPERIAALKKYQ